MLHTDLSEFIIYVPIKKLLQLQQERRKIRTELDESLKVNAVLRQELESRNSQLEEAEWAVCLLKAQLKDYQVYIGGILICT